MPYHHIPNCQLGQFGARHGINIFFPRLYTKERISPRLSTDEQATLYNKGIRPSVDELLPFEKNDWPANYEGEIFRAARRRGGISYQTKVINDMVVNSFVDTIRTKLVEHGIDWGQGAFVIHMVRGMKASTRHSVSRQAAMEELKKFLREMDIDPDYDNDCWYIDVGLEISSEEDNCFQWLTTSHPSMLEWILGLPEHDAIRLGTFGSTRYQRDISSHLPQLSGCRVEPGVRGAGRYMAVYYQQYTSEKALTYNPEKGDHGKTITMKEAMGNKQPANFCDKLYQTFIDAKENNASAARVEVRVPVGSRFLGVLDEYGEPIYSLECSTSVMTYVSRTVLRRSIRSYTKKTWW